MYDRKDVPSVLNGSDLVLSDDIKSLKKQLKTDSFDYIDIASMQAWKKSLREWPLLAEWDVWSKR